MEAPGQLHAPDFLAAGKNTLYPPNMMGLGALEKKNSLKLAGN